MNRAAACLYDTHDVGLPTRFQFNVGPVAASMPTNCLRRWPNTTLTLGPVYTQRQHPSKHVPYTQYCFNVVSTSSTLAQHWNSICLFLIVMRVMFFSSCRQKSHYSDNMQGGGGAGGARPLFFGKYFKMSLNWLIFTKKSWGQTPGAPPFLRFWIRHWHDTLAQCWCNAGHRLCRWAVIIPTLFWALITNIIVNMVFS